MKICNSIVCLDTKRKINLIGLAEKCNDQCKYRPQRFPGLSLRVPEFNTTILVFKSGKLVATGAKLIGDAYDSFSELLDLLDFPLVLVKLAKVQNNVASGELFPGLKYRLKTCRVSVIIFAWVKYVITGSKYLGDFHRSDAIVKALLSSCAL